MLIAGQLALEVEREDSNSEDEYNPVTLSPTIKKLHPGNLAKVTGQGKIKGTGQGKSTVVSCFAKCGVTKVLVSGFANGKNGKKLLPPSIIQPVEKVESCQVFSMFIFLFRVLHFLTFVINFAIKYLFLLL